MSILELHELVRTYDIYTCSAYIVGLKRIVILAFEYSLSFQTNSLNNILNIRSSKITVFYRKMMLISVDLTATTSLTPLI